MAYLLVGGSSQSAARYEFATPGYWFGFLGNLYPTYVRRAAYLAKREARKPK